MRLYPADFDFVYHVLYQAEWFEYAASFRATPLEIMTGADERVLKNALNQFISLNGGIDRAKPGEVQRAKYLLLRIRGNPWLT